MIIAARAHKKTRGGTEVIISWRNQPDRRSSASWAPPLIAAPRLPYAAIETMIIAEASPASASPP
jgi:hypothetical protein